MIRVFVAGDYYPCDRIKQMLQERDYSFFDEVKEVTNDCDYSILNFESPVVIGTIEPIKKCGPALRTDANAVDSIRYAGFDCVTLANNHFRDFGDAGCETTLAELEKQGVDFVGGGVNLKEAQKILYKDIDGVRLAIVNMCENEFSIASVEKAGAAPLDLIDNYSQIQSARKNADFVLVIVHGGHEHYQLPSPRMKKTYRHFVDLGADAVINHHQHCFSGYEYYCGKPIVYGLGNFCFDRTGQRGNIWNEGYGVKLFFDKQQATKIKLFPYHQCDDDASVKFLTEAQKEEFGSAVERLNSIISDDAELQKQFDKWVESHTQYKMNVFASYHNRYLNAAASRGYIPRLISKREMAALLNHICCEAHRDISLQVLAKELEK